MSDNQQPFQPPLPPGMHVPAGQRGEEKSMGEAAQTVKTQPVGVGAVYTNTRLTPSEKKALEQFGWKEGDPIPADMAQLMQSAGHLPNSPGAVELPASSPDAERTPLSAAQHTQGTDALAAAKVALAHTMAMGDSQADPSVQKAIDAGRGVAEPDVEIVDDTKKPDDTIADEAGSNPPLLKCPHCEWDLRMRDPVVISEADKQRFLQAILGQTAFHRAFTVLGGALKVVFRSLTPPELDSCFEQAYLERRQGKYQAPDAYFELLNRYRLSLQLVRIETTGGVNHVFPRSIKEWEEKLGDVADPSSDLAVKRICEFVFEHVVKSESMNRILAGLGGEFNSLVGKLEANTTNSDFWSTTRSVT